MRLALYSIGAGEARPALVAGERVYDIARRVPGAPAAMIPLLESLSDLRPALQALSGTEPDHLLFAVRLHAPVPRPGKILALGLNYRDHAAEANLELPQHQTWFAKMVTTVNDPTGDVQLPRVSSKLDYEAELALVIGRRCRHVPRDQARQVIAGYCVANDVSVRDWQMRTTQFVLGKSFDSHCPFGPWIVTGDELGDPQQLGIRCFVNGEQRQNSNTREMVFDVYAMVEHLSQAMTLEPGDLLLTGTPAGVGAVRKLYLKAGDVVRTEIDGIGHLENRVVAEAAG